MAARYRYYILADSPEGVAKEAGITGKTPPAYQTSADIKKGFVYKRVPHLTLKSIANNPEIDTIHAKWQEKLEPLRAELNALLVGAAPRGRPAGGTRGGVPLQEWQLPREPEDAWPAEAKKALADWWSTRRERQEEIDASIARNADVELLYDQPYENTKTVRVTGPFTVESLSPHRVLSPDEERPESETEGQKESAAGQFVPMILDNLRKAGVQIRFKDEHLGFDRLEPYAGEWLHAEGEYAPTPALPVDGEEEGISPPVHGG
jgi:adenine-specific DNA-methyltransferase